MKLRRFAARPMICVVLCILTAFSGCSRINENSVYPIPDDFAGSLSANPQTDEKSYIYSSLSAKEREYYDILRAAVYDFREQAVFPEKLSPELLRKLFIGLYYDDAELFWLSSLFYRPTEASDTLALSYRCDRETAERMRRETEKKAAAIIEGIGDSASDYEKLRAFHDHIVLNCTFAEDTQFGNTPYGVLCEGYAACEGYAFAFDYLCLLSDITCYTVTGTDPDGAAHAWNIVLLDGQWYHVDCTWDDPILSPVDTEFIRHYYFLVSDADISGVTHIADNTYFSLPICTSRENYYVREGYFAAGGAEGAELLKRAAADALAAGRKDAGVRFSDRRAYDEAVRELFSAGGIKEVFAYANGLADQKVNEGKYVRYLNADELIIHISMIYA